MFTAFTKLFLLSALGGLVYFALVWFLQRRRSSQVTTALRGPETSHFLWGWTQTIFKADDDARSDLYENWIEEFGSVISVPTALFGRQVILADPKAIAHFYAHDSSIYVHDTLTRVLFEATVGANNLISSEGSHHKRLRKTLTPAFSTAAIRRLTDVFYGAAYKTREHWEAILEANGGECIIDVQEWMNHISLDSIGIAGFGHDFGSLDGQQSRVVDVLSELVNQRRTLIDTTVFFLSILFPRVFTRVPTRLNRLQWRFRATMLDTAEELLLSTKLEKKASGEYSIAEKSIIGLLINAESHMDNGKGMTKEEVTDQISLLLLAGYETTSISLTWALIELSRNPAIQTQLRDELQLFAADPTYDQLASTTALPFLDAVVHETLRLHPALPESERIASADDILPLSRPYTTSKGTVVDRISIAKGTCVTAPIIMINRFLEVWGTDSKLFNPSRWLQREPKDNPLPGYRHLLTFSDGPRTCLGKNFALTEFKAALFVLIKTFTFEFPNGPQTEIGRQRTLIKRPKVVGEDGARIPLRIRKI
ncbi:cytochrome P450 [Flagelloscypha sp. PMI_526]|nr:cytochrome P450 [Flagelloscypha sp. PMI_526]